MINNLDDWRSKLREIDNQLLVLLKRRLSLAVTLKEILRTEELCLGDSTHNDLRLGLLMLSEYDESLTPLDGAAVERIFRRIAVEIRRLSTSQAGDADPGVGPRLTFRELQILILIAEDHSLKEIGLRLSISVKTVETHRAAVMSKLGIHSTVGLARYALRKGLIVL